MIEAQAKAGGMVLNSEGLAKEQTTPSSKPLDSPVLPLQPSERAPTEPESLELDVVNGEDPSFEEPSTKRPRVVMQPFVIVPDPSYLQEVSKYGPHGRPMQTPECTAVLQAPTSSSQVGGLMSTLGGGMTFSEELPTHLSVGGSAPHGCALQHSSGVPAKSLQALR